MPGIAGRDRRAANLIALFLRRRWREGPDGQINPVIRPTLFGGRVILLLGLARFAKVFKLLLRRRRLDGFDRMHLNHRPFEQLAPLIDHRRRLVGCRQGLTPRIRPPSNEVPVVG